MNYHNVRKETNHCMYTHTYDVKTTLPSLTALHNNSIKITLFCHSRVSAFAHTDTGRKREMNGIYTLYLPSLSQHLKSSSGDRNG